MSENLSKGNSSHHSFRKKMDKFKKHKKDKKLGDSERRLEKEKKKSSTNVKYYEEKYPMAGEERSRKEKELEKL